MNKKNAPNLEKIKNLEIVKNNLLNELHNHIKKIGGESALQVGNIPEVMQWGITGKLIFCYLLNPKVQTPDMYAKILQLKAISLAIIEEQGYKQLEENVYKNLREFNYTINSNLLYRCFTDDTLYMRFETAIDFLTDLYFSGKIKESDNKKFANATINYIKTYFNNKHYMSVEEESKNIDSILEKFNQGCELKKQREKYKNLVETETNDKLKNILKFYSMVR